MSDSPFRPLIIGFLRRGYSSSGGVEVYLKGLASGLLALGHRVVLFGTDEWPQVSWPGGEILRCRGGTLGGYIGDIERIKKESGLIFDLILSVEKVPGCDLYRTDEGLHLAWLTERSARISRWARYFQWINPKHREKLVLERALFHSGSTRRVISISEKITRDIISLYAYPKEQIRLIRNGVKQMGLSTIEEKNAARDLFGLSHGQQVVLFVGTGWERKGLNTAIQAVERLRGEFPKITLLVAGKGPIRRYKSSVIKFLGPVKQMKSVYAAGDLFITPTIFEPFSLAAMEALSAGLPVITSAAAGISEVMVPGVHGEVIPKADDVKAFTVGIRSWLEKLNDPLGAERVHADCAALAAEFTLERNLEQTMTVIQELLGEKSKSEKCG